MSKAGRIPTFESLKAKEIGRAPVLFKVAQQGPAPGGQGLGGVITGRPDEMQAPESADTQRYEQDLSGLAYQFVKDRAPALLPYMLGFEVVDRNEDGSKAVGIYGYKIDDDFYYIPIFFINNQIRGVDMILNKRTNSFLPLTENWINYIIDRHAVTIGETANKGVEQTFEQPDLEFLRAPKNQPTMKSAEENDPLAKPWSLKTAWHMMQKRAEFLANKDPLVSEMFNGVLRSVKGVPFKKQASADGVKQFIELIGGPESQVSLYKTFRNVKFANAALTLYKDMSAFDVQDATNAYVHAKKRIEKIASAPKVRVVTAEDLKTVEDDTSAPASTDSREDAATRILGHGFTIEDKRPDEEHADVIDDPKVVDFETRFSSPTEVGLYSFMMADGRARIGYLLSLTHCPAACSKDTTLVYFPKDKIAAIAPLSEVVVMSGMNAVNDSSLSGSYAEFFEKAKDVGSIEPDASASGKAYIFVGPRGQALAPLRVLSVFKDGDDVSFSISDATYDHCVTTASRGKPDFGSWDIHDRFHDANGYRKENVYVDGLSGNPYVASKTLRFCSGISKPTVTSRGIVVPDSWKVVEVASTDPHEDSNGRSIDEVRQADEKKRHELSEKYTFGSMSCILETMRNEGFTRVKLASADGGYYIHVDGFAQTPKLTYKQAALALVTKFNTRPASAFMQLDKAAEEGSARFIISTPDKLSKAAQVGGGVGVNMPMPIQQEASVDPYTGIPVYQEPYIDQQHGQFNGVPSLPDEGGLTRGIADGSEIQRATAQGAEGAEGAEGSPEGEMKPIDQQAQELAAQAAEAGQRHVFDQAAIGGLSKVYDTSAVVDSYIPNFMDTLDRLGRVLFLFYWKHDEFNGRYGSDDVVEMEDRLRGVFKELGELTLKLKEKAVRQD
jgi:hypothetical protein